MITGLGAVTPYGLGAGAMFEGLLSGDSAVSRIPDSQKIPHIECHIAGIVPKLEAGIPREIRRAMSPMSVYAWLAAKEALEAAGLSGGGDIGVAISSTLGSGEAISDIFKTLHERGDLDPVRTMSFFKILGHSVSSNLVCSLGLSGRQISPAAACSTGLQSAGLAYEALAFGRAEIMLAGGAEEFSFLSPASFDKIGAASHERDPARASVPFDRRRAGVVCGEGAGVLVLEELEGALARGAPILAEIAGFATVSSASMARLDREAARRCMALALADAGISPEEIVYVNAHATGTLGGDAAEAWAIADLFRHRPLVSGLKGYMGHTLAAAGAVELAACVKMLQAGVIAGMSGSFEPDAETGALNFAMTGRKLESGYILKNSFGLGGVYSALVIAPFAR